MLYANRYNLLYILILYCVAYFFKVLNVFIKYQNTNDLCNSAWILFIKYIDLNNMFYQTHDVHIMCLVTLNSDSF